MLKSLKFLVVAGVLFIGFGYNTTYASDDQNVTSKSTNNLWDEVENLPSETTMFYKDKGAKTATAKVNTYPGSVPANTEFRAHGTHTITKGLKQSLGYTGDSLKF